MLSVNMPRHVMDHVSTCSLSQIRNTGLCLVFLVFKVNGQHRDIFVLADFCYSHNFRGYSEVRERRKTNYFEKAGENLGVLIVVSSVRVLF